ncbi:MULTISPECIES: hypothetical protein [unclassified Streptomyces]|uniref:hypothetical protein n=1 Tax=unclassified Streptomyces TaxID=2593676 RepID=UPI002E0FB5BB|nr:hypothetical protein OG299_34490 [Streptomyces sp. NBC_01296]
MAWGTAMGSRWVALAGIIAVSSGSAHLRAGATGTDALVTHLVCAAVLVGSWGGWLLWQTRRVPPHLRRPLLLVSRGCRPVLGMAFAIALLIVHPVLALVLWRSALFGALAIPLFFFALVMSVAGRTTLLPPAPSAPEAVAAAPVPPPAHEPDPEPEPEGTIPPQDRGADDAGLPRHDPKAQPGDGRESTCFAGRTFCG